MRRQIEGRALRRHAFRDLLALDPDLGRVEGLSTLDAEPLGHLELRPIRNSRREDLRDARTLANDERDDHAGTVLAHEDLDVVELAGFVELLDRARHVVAPKWLSDLEAGACLDQR